MLHDALAGEGRNEHGLCFGVHSADREISHLSRVKDARREHSFTNNAMQQLYEMGFK